MPIDKVSVRQQQTMALKSSFTSNTGKKNSYIQKKSFYLYILFNCR